MNICIYVCRGRDVQDRDKGVCVWGGGGRENPPSVHTTRLPVPRRGYLLQLDLLDLHRHHEG